MTTASKESPSLLTGTNSQQTLPTFNKHRVWSFPEIQSHAVVVLTASKMYIVPGNAAPPEDKVRQLENGADPVDLFGSFVTIVKLEFVKKVVHELLTNEVQLEMNVSSQSGAWISRVDLKFKESDSADAMFTKIWRRLGDQFVVRPDRPTTAKAIQAPLFGLGVVLVLTAMFVWMANAAADFGTNVPVLLSPFKNIDWKVIAIFGGILAALMQVWLYRSWTTPPNKLELIRKLI